MSGTNWNAPVITDTIVNYNAFIQARDVSAMTQMRSSLTADTNIPTKAIRWNDTNFNWESWSGTAWGALATIYRISISGNAATATSAASATAIAWSGITGKPTTISGYGIADLSSYAPTLTGGGASGTWGISISGTAANANATPWSGVSSKPTTISGYGITDAAPTNNPTFTGAVNEAVGTAIASSATVNLTTATGNLVHITGSATITTITLATGARRTVVFDGASVLTDSSNLILPSGVNITTAIDDTATFIGEAGGIVRCISYERASGYPLISSGKISTCVITDSADHSLAAGGGAGNTNVGSSFSMNIPVDGVIQGISWTLAGLGSTTAAAHNICFGLRIGTTNYWFNTVNGNNIQFSVGATSNASKSFSWISDNSIIDVTKQGLPTGVQTVQLIAGYITTLTTLKGTTLQTRVVFGAIG